MLRSFDDVLKLAQNKGVKRLSVAVAEDEQVLKAVKKAVEFKLIDPILIGNKKKIEDISLKIGLNLSKVEIVDKKDPLQACREAVRLVSSGQADFVMKGIIDTAVIMKQALDKEIGLRTGNNISHVGVFSVPTYHKVFLVTDAAMNIYPNLEQKREIIENAVELAHSLEIENPKIAIICAREKVNPKMQVTIEARELQNMNKRGQISGCTIGGPLALDNAISKESANHKGIDNPVAGDADILVVPNIETGNVLYKSLTYFANSKVAGIIIGAKAPMVVTSRSDTEEAKLYSIALGVLLTSKKLVTLKN